jgi:hypothetical protein
MSNRTLTDAVSSKPILGKGLVQWESFAMRYTRFRTGGRVFIRGGRSFWYLGRKYESRQLQAFYGIHGES